MIYIITWTYILFTFSCLLCLGLIFLLFILLPPTYTSPCFNIDHTYIVRDVYMYEYRDVYELPLPPAAGAKLAGTGADSIIY